MVSYNISSDFMKLGNPILKLKNFIKQCRRVLMVSSKPDKEEFNASAKITAIGTVIIGIIGFIIFMIAMLIGGV
jgi:protein transport protein SEC61 subunit gamma-like protein